MELLKFDYAVRFIAGVANWPGGGNPSAEAPTATDDRDEKETSQIIEVGRYGQHKAIVTGLAFSPDGKHVLSVSDDQTVRYWEFETGKTVHSFDGGGGMRTGVISPDGRLAASAGFRNAILLWDLTTGKSAGSLDTRSDQFLAVRFSRTGRFLVSKSRNGKVHVWNLATKKIIREFDAGVRYGYGLAGSPPDSDRFATQGADETFVYDFDMGELFQLPATSSGLAFSPDGKYLLIGNTLWNLETKKQEQRFPGADRSIRSAGFFADGRHVWIASSNEKAIRVCETKTGREVAAVTCDTFVTTIAAVSPDGRHMVSGGGFQADPFKRDGDYTVRLWRLPERVWPGSNDK